jgi:AcrR family transcriptional regulator
MNGKENQRVMLTKRLIKESLIRLLAGESIYKISIRALCEDAGINRSTFYKYYKSQYNVLTEMESELLWHIQEALRASSEDPARQITTICSYLEANADLVRLLTNNNIDTDFPGKLFNLPLIRQMLHDRTFNRYDEESFDYVVTFVISGGYYLIRDWISRDERKPANEIAGLVLQLEEKVCR